MPSDTPAAPRPRRRAALLALCAAAGLAVACGRRRTAELPPAPTRGAEAVEPTGAEGSKLKMTDEIGRPVTPRALPARRVVSLAPNVTELLFALGADAELVGVDNFSDQPQPQVERVAHVGSDYTPSLEKILALAPDVVFASMTANRRETVDSLEALGVPTFVTDTRSLGDMDRLWRDLGRLTGHPSSAEAAIGHLHAALERVRAVSANQPKTRVLVVVWSEPLFVAGRDTFVDDLIEVAGGQNVARDVAGFVRYPLEKVLAVAPEVIVIPTHVPAQRGAAAISFWAQWTTLPAVQNGRIHAVEDSLIIRPGARLGAGAETLRALLHPARTPDAAAGASGVNAIDRGAGSP